MTILAQLLALALPFAILERLPGFRLRPARLLRPWVCSDALYLLTGYWAGALLGTAYILEGTRWAGTTLALPRLASLDLAPWIAVPAALLAIDLGNYLAHALLHRVDALWEIHKVHHSSRHLDWLATFRSHLLEQMLRRLLAPLLLIVGGFPVEVVTVAYGIFLAFAIWNHSNLRAASFRFLEPIFISPRLHRLHHIPATTECNLGTVFSLWDRWRGTLVAHDTAAEAGFGVPGEVESYPQGWGRQLVEPLARILGVRRRRGAPIGGRSAH